MDFKDFEPCGKRPAGCLPEVVFQLKQVRFIHLLWPGLHLLKGQRGRCQCLPPAFISSQGMAAFPGRVMAGFAARMRQLYSGYGTLLAYKACDPAQVVDMCVLP